MAKKEQEVSTFKAFMAENPLVFGYPCRRGNKGLSPVAIPRKKGRVDISSFEVIQMLKASGKKLQPKLRSPVLPDRTRS